MELYYWQIMELRKEYERATENHKPMNSAHEGYAVILEELDELKAEVFKKQGTRSHDKMRHEAIQVAAMAIRFIFDVCLEKE